MEIPGGGGGGGAKVNKPFKGGYDKHPLQCIMEIPGGWGGGSKVNMPFMGVWIFSGTTQ